MDHPVLIFGLSFLLLWASAWGGARLHRKYPALEAEDRNDIGIILGATLTLLGLILGFSFSMAISRYDQRKNLEEQEANAIGTEYIRADLLPASSATTARTLLARYLEERIAFYRTRDDARLREIDNAIARLQGELWLAVAEPASAQPTSVVVLAVSGMNDVLNSQGYTQAAWWNRIPAEGWILMGAIAICSNFLLGFCIRRPGTRGTLLLILPLVISISFSLIADIDSPRGGFIRVLPQNLESLEKSLHL